MKAKKHKSKATMKSGVVAVTTVLILGAVIVEIGVAGTIIAYLLNNSNYGARLSSEALAASKAGIHDAWLKIAGNKDFSSAGYTLSVGTRSTDVVVCKDFVTTATDCDTASAGKTEIISTGRAVSVRRRFRAVVDVNALTGESKIVSEKETAL